MITCTFCGYNFSEEDADKSCSGCPMSKSCNKLKCPKCNFENVRPLKFPLLAISNWLLAKTRAKKAKANGQKPIVDTNNLTELKIGQQAEIMKLDVLDNNDLKKLTIFGIIPKEEVLLLQKYPSYVIKVGNTQVALDKHIASCIKVVCRKK